MLKDLGSSLRGQGPSLVVVTLLAGVSVAVSLLLVTTTIWLDDPFIGMRYAHNLADGKGLVFNPGEAIEGYTAWLWVMFSWVAHEAGIEPLGFWQGIGVASQVATLYVLFLLARPEQRPAWQSLLAPALLALHIGWVTWSVAGLSADFVALLVTLAILMLERRVLERTSGALALGGVLLVLCLTRFDGLITAGVIMSYVVLVDRQLKKAIPTIVVLAIGLALYNAWRMTYYDTLLPNTFYAKQSTLANDLKGGLRYLTKFAREGGPFVVLLAVVPLTLKGASRGVKLAAWTTIGHLLYVMTVGGDWMKYHRFVVPVLPLMCLMLQDGLVALADRTRAAGLSRGKTALLTTLAALTLLLWEADTIRSSKWVGGVEHRPGSYWHPPDAREISRHLDQALPPDALVATEWAGILPYYMRQPILDIFGLNDRDIIEGDFPGSKMGRGVTAEYVVGRAPDVYIVGARIFPTAEKALEMLNARPVGSHPQKLADELLQPGNGYVPCVLRIGELGYWSCLMREDFAGRSGLCVGS